jgi:glutamate-1-semialdehyde 2,1-aminomutase
MVRLVSSGTEATISALRLARAATGRDRLVKLAGCYHGHGDPFLVAAGSGAATLGTPSSPGVPRAVTADTLVAPYNDLDALAALFARHGREIAALFVEPVAGNMGLVPPRPGYLAGLRALCDEHGSLLVFDEVMTGFRVAWGGAQALYEIRPDLTCLGKVVGGGLPAAAYGGRAELMAQIAPDGPVYQAGTLSGNPLAMAAGLATLERLRARGTYSALARRTRELTEGLAALARESGLPFTTAAVGGMFGFFFHPGPVRSFDDARKSHAERFRRFFYAMLEGGVYLAPSAYEAGFVSLAHGAREIARTLEAARRAFRIAAEVD